MTSASPPSVLAQLFNNGYYTNLSSPLTLKAADSRYLKLNENGKYKESEVDKNLRQLFGARRQLFELKTSMTYK